MSKESSSPVAKPKKGDVPIRSLPADSEEEACKSSSFECIRPADIECGQWFYYQSEPDQTPWLGCIMQIGSNFVELRGVGLKSYYFERIGLDEEDRVLRRVPDIASLLKSEIARAQAEVLDVLSLIEQKTEALGLRPPNERSTENKALAIMSTAIDVQEYKKALVKAKGTDFPDLLKKAKDANQNLADWMAAEMLPLMSQENHLRSRMGNIDQKINSIDVYAGLSEEVVVVRKQKAPAPEYSKLHVMQRRLYMDEECLLDYRHGGMEFTDISQFDKWLCKPKNLNRILPFPRCIVAMRVRRRVKDRENDGTLTTALINITLAQSDLLTFIYIRNGEDVYRINSKLEFGRKLFPDKDFNTTEPTMIRMFARSVRGRMSLAEWEDRMQEGKKALENYKKWEKENPREEWQKDNPHSLWSYANPHSKDMRAYHRLKSEWKLLDPEKFLYYDEVMQEEREALRHYNNAALLIQGLLDRSTVLDPHPPQRLWDADGFQEAIKLVYDDDLVLSHGPTPNLEEYMAKCNVTLQAGCVTLGQEDFWLRKEATKENSRMSRLIRGGSRFAHNLFRPDDDPGPGLLAVVQKGTLRARSLLFTWQRPRKSLNTWESNSSLLNRNLYVSKEKLFNVSAYKQGDYEQFFRDPRTRKEYMKWAPMLLTAEEYCAGNLKVGESGDYYGDLA